VRGVHLADWPGRGNGPGRGWGRLGWRVRALLRQRSHVRIVSGAPEKHVPRVPGLWRAISCRIGTARSATTPQSRLYGAAPPRNPSIRHNPHLTRSCWTFAKSSWPIPMGLGDRRFPWRSIERSPGSWLSFCSLLPPALPRWEHPRRAALSGPLTWRRWKSSRLMKISSKLGNLKTSPLGQKSLTDTKR